MPPIADIGYGMQLTGVTTPSILSPAFFGFIASFDDVIVSLYLGGANRTCGARRSRNAGMRIGERSAGMRLGPCQDRDIPCSDLSANRDPPALSHANSPLITTYLSAPPPATKASRALPSRGPLHA
jgi:hypothetical protein